MIFRKRKDRRQLSAELGELLREVWDPIGVRDRGRASRGEYVSYVGPLLEMLRRGRPAEQVAFYLSGIRTEQMGLESAFSADEAAAEKIIDWFQKRAGSP